MYFLCQTPDFKIKLSIKDVSNRISSESVQKTLLIIINNSLVVLFPADMQMGIIA